MAGKNIKFEEAMTRLEELIVLLEDGEVSLDGAIEAYEEAIKLVKICNNRLESAEKKIRLLLESDDGTVVDKPFDSNAD